MTPEQVDQLIAALNRIGARLSDIGWMLFFILLAMAFKKMHG